jgi:hypothetical protein
MLLAASQKNGQEMAREIRFVARMDYNAVGSTKCELGEPRITILSGQSKDERFKTFMHEKRHEKQMLNYPGGCEATVRRYRSDPKFRFKTELEAYCTEMNLELNFYKRELLLDRLSSSLFSNYPFSGLSILRAKKIVYKTCNKMQGGRKSSESWALP